MKTKSLSRQLVMCDFTTWESEGSVQQTDKCISLACFSPKIGSRTIGLPFKGHHTTQDL